MHPDDFDALTDAYLPDSALSRFVRAVFTARRLGHEETVGYADTEADNLRPYTVRAQLQGLLRASAEIMPGATARNAKTSNWNHVEICAGPLILTAHSVQSPCGVVADVAAYQLALAQGNRTLDNQASLFDDDLTPTQSRYYVTLLHSPFRGATPVESRKYTFLPGSLYLAYPHSDMGGYFHRINLFGRFSQIVDELLPNEWNEQARVYYRWQAKRLATG